MGVVRGVDHLEKVCQSHGLAIHRELDLRSRAEREIAATVQSDVAGGLREVGLGVAFGHVVELAARGCLSTKHRPQTRRLQGAEGRHLA